MLFDQKRSKGQLREILYTEMGGGEKSADKPGSVVDSHSSRAYVTVYLKQPTRIQCGSHHRIPIWSCSKRGLPSP